MESEKKYKIILDTNFIRQHDDSVTNVVFNYSLNSIKDFIKKHSLTNIVTIAIPEIVRKEIYFQIYDRVINKLESVKNIDTYLKDLSIRKTLIIHSKDISKKIENKIKNIFEDLKVEVLVIPKVDNKILDRSLNHKPPFSVKGDNGFKDSMIWLTIIEDAKHNPDVNYILCTSDKLFKDSFEELEKEFKGYTNKNLYLKESTAELEGFLDKEINLKLELKKRNSEIENELKQKYGDIALEVNKYLVYHKMPWYSRPSIAHSRNIFPRSSFKYQLGSVTGIGDSPAVIDNGSEIAGYNFQDFRIIDISSIDNKSFKIIADLFLVARTKDDSYSIFLPDNSEIIAPRIQFVYNRENKSIAMVSVSSDYFSL